VLAAVLQVIDGRAVRRPAWIAQDGPALLADGFVHAGLDKGLGIRPVPVDNTNSVVRRPRTVSPVT